MDLETNRSPVTKVNHKSAFERIAKRLRLTEKRASTKTTQETAELEKRVDRLERRQNIIAGINPDVVRRADVILKGLDEGRMSAEQFAKMTFGEKLDMIAEKQDRKQQLEYAKMIAENNNNNNH